MRDDALPGKPLALGAGVVVVIVALAICTVVLLLRHRQVPRGGVPVARPVALPEGEPALQTAPQLDLVTYRRAQSLALGRADDTHVPITAAMEGLVAASGASAPKVTP